MNESGFMTVREVADYLKMRPLAIYRKVKRREIPFLKAGRSIRFQKDEIDRWLRWGGI
jgi:excisionase family DNA binding protein